jgi:hypothetical protein
MHNTLTADVTKLRQDPVCDKTLSHIQAWWIAGRELERAQLLTAPDKHKNWCGRALITAIV